MQSAEARSKVKKSRGFLKFLAGYRNENDDVRYSTINANHWKDALVEAMSGEKEFGQLQSLEMF